MSRTPIMLAIGVVAVVAAGVFYTGQASAACPTSADLDGKGILFIEQGPRAAAVKIARRVASDRILSGSYISPRDDGPDMLSASYRGYYELASAEGDAVSAGLSYSVDPTTVIPFGEGDKITVTTEEWVSDITLAIGETGAVTLNGCSYDAVQIREMSQIKLADGQNASSRTEYLYIPELAYKTFGDFDTIDTLQIRVWQDGDPVIADFR